MRVNKGSILYATNAMDATLAHGAFVNLTINNKNTSKIFCQTRISTFQLDWVPTSSFDVTPETISFS